MKAPTPFCVMVSCGGDAVAVVAGSHLRFRDRTNGLQWHLGEVQEMLSVHIVLYCAVVAVEKRRWRWRSSKETMVLASKTLGPPTPFRESSTWSSTFTFTVATPYHTTSRPERPRTKSYDRWTAHRMEKSFLMTFK